MEGRAVLGRGLQVALVLRFAFHNQVVGGWKVFLQGLAGLSSGRQGKACPTWDKLQLVQASQARPGPQGHGHSLAAAAQ
jgi:hypothetical protein